MTMYDAERTAALSCPPMTGGGYMAQGGGAECMPGCGVGMCSGKEEGRSHARGVGATGPIA
jgi:hypothetical protein